MSRIVYVNGRYVPYAQAAVHVEDRGFQFADGIYEVCEVRGGHLVDEARHMARLTRSLGELQIAQPMRTAALAHVMRQVIRRNRVRNGLVYLQVTRGAAPREFDFPDAGVTPTVVCLARSISPARVDANAATGIAVKSMPDIRWQRCDIKTVMLLPACLAKEAARKDGAREAWFVDQRRPRHRGGLEQRLDRRPVRRCHHPAIGRRYPARRDACNASRRDQRGGDATDRAALRADRGLRRPRGIHHLGDADRDARRTHRRTLRRRTENRARSCSGYA